MPSAAPEVTLRVAELALDRAFGYQLEIPGLSEFRSTRELAPDAPSLLFPGLTAEEAYHLALEATRSTGVFVEWETEPMLTAGAALEAGLREVQARGFTRYAIRARSFSGNVEASFLQGPFTASAEAGSPETVTLTNALASYFACPVRRVGRLRFAATPSVNGRRRWLRL